MGEDSLQLQIKQRYISFLPQVDSASLIPCFSFHECHIFQLLNYNNKPSHSKLNDNWNYHSCTI